MSTVRKWQEANKVWNWENSAGVKNLCRLVHELGHIDPFHFGQFAHDGSYGDLIEFLSDNPGAIKAVVDWIDEQNYPPYDDEDEDDEEVEDDTVDQTV